MTRPSSAAPRAASTPAAGDSEHVEPESAEPWKWLGAAALALLLTWYFFEVLWLGGGLVGGDLYPYFFPQKTVYAAALREGEVPLWNPLVGHGYPQLAESQTGVFYPFHLAAYWLWDVNTAYVAVQLTHYVIAFLGAVALARATGTGWGGGLLAALVYTYGWFPARLCLEWAIIGGAWLPWCVWGLVRWRDSDHTRADGHGRYLFVVWGGLTLQLLAGHFVFAFMTQLVVATWLVVFFVVDVRSAGEPPDHRRRAVRRLAIGGAAIVAAYLAAAVQLVPTWEYKQLSQRARVSGSFDPAYGHLPWWSLQQATFPWSWYADTTDINNRRGPDEPLTNRAEAHLYFGLVPLALLGTALFGAAARGVRRRHHSREAGNGSIDAPSPPQPAIVRGENSLVGEKVSAGRMRGYRHAPLDPDFAIVVWFAIGLLALIHATAQFRSLTDRLPGFGYFTGPGRFGAITTLAVAIIAGLAWRRMSSRWPARWGVVAGTVVWVATVVDLGWVDAHTQNVFQVLDAPLEERRHSPLRALLAEPGQPVRLFCRGQNVATLLDVASTPTYLGLSPAQYQDPATALPEPFPFDTPPAPSQIDWLRRAGVTHVLNFSRLDERVWPVRHMAVVDDPFLNRVWGRYAGATAPPTFWLYELLGSRGRVAWETPAESATARVVSHRRERVEIEAEHPTGGRLVLTDLAYPGWEVTVDGQPAAQTTVEGTYRGVDVPAGRHTIVWEYRPASFRIGLGMSLVTLIAGGFVGVFAGVPRWLRTRATTF